MHSSVTATPSVRVIAPTFVEGGPAAQSETTEERPAKQPAKLEVSLTLEGESNLYCGFDTRGIFVATWQLLDAETEVDVTFSSDDGRVGKARGVVRWVREYHPSFPDTTPGMAVELEELGEDADAAFESFAKRREPLFYD